MAHRLVYHSTLGWREIKKKKKKKIDSDERRSGRCGVPAALVRPGNARGVQVGCVRASVCVTVCECV